MQRSELAALADELDAVRRSRLPNMAEYAALLERAIVAFVDDPEATQEALREGKTQGSQSIVTHSAEGPGDRSKLLEMILN